VNDAITEAEAQVMQVLWRRHPSDARTIAQTLEKETGWRRTTVNTLLARLEKKGAVGVEDGSSPKRYIPLIEAADYSRASTRRLVDLLFEGRIAPLVASFAGEKPLPPEELEELRALVEKMSDDAEK
jgi:predicted transcriptional regulator